MPFSLDDSLRFAKFSRSSIYSSALATFPRLPLAQCLPEFAARRGGVKVSRSGGAGASLTASARDDGYFFSFSIPLVAPLPGFVAQQKAESSPHALQLCLSSTMSPLAWPTTVKVELQPAHAWVPINSVGWPFSIRSWAPFTPCFTRVTQTVLHLTQTIAMLSSVLSLSTSCLVLT